MTPAPRSVDGAPQVSWWVVPPEQFRAQCDLEQAGMQRSRFGQIVGIYGASEERRPAERETAA